MKKITVYILALVLLFACLSGCKAATNPTATATPKATVQPTATPAELLPSAGNGIVKDDDGILSPSPSATAKPSAGAAAKPGTSTSPSASAGTAG